MRTINCTFDVKFVLDSNGAIDEEATLTAFGDNLSTEIENRATGAVRVREAAEAVYAKAGNPEYLPKGVVEMGVMTALGANIENWGQTEKLVSDGLALCLTGSVAGSKLVPVEVAIAKKADRMAKRAATKAAKAQ